MKLSGNRKLAKASGSSHRSLRADRLAAIHVHDRQRLMNTAAIHPHRNKRRPVARIRTRARRERE